MKKILIISDATWDVNNNVGNTLSNLFGNMDLYQFHMIYAKDTIPNNTTCTSYLQVSEARMIKSIFKKKINITNVFQNKISLDDNIYKDKELGIKIYKIFKFRRSKIFLLIREILWRIQFRKVINGIDQYLNALSPDLVFYLPTQNIYMNKIYSHVIYKSSIPGIIFFMDDVLNSSNLSYFERLNFYQNKINSEILSCVTISSKIFSITDKQRKIYKSKFNIESEVLNKSHIHDQWNAPNSLNSPRKIIYTGNLYAGRLKTLMYFLKLISEINKNELNFVVEIYTADKLSRTAVERINSNKGASFRGSVDRSQIQNLLMQSDYLLHLESFERKYVKAVSLSLSTKIVDYLHTGKPIIAIGDKNCASIEYLFDNNAAITIMNEHIDFLKLYSLLCDNQENKKIIANASELAIKNHNYITNYQILLKRIEECLNNEK